MRHPSLFRVLLSLFGLSLLSCQNDDGPPIYEEGSNEYINQWVYEQMERYYYWNENMPARGDLSLNPKDYFGQLLHPDDPYSYAVHPALPETFPQNMRRTFGFDMTLIQYQGQFYGAILYVLSGSPAQNTGLQRGQFITSINGTPLNQGNFEALYENLAHSDAAQLQVVNYTPQLGLSAPEEVHLSQQLTFSQPIPHHIIMNGTDKVGYIEIPHFDIGQAYLFQEIFQEFKNQSINELVIDLRYNGGGDISSATALGIILAPNIQSDALFIKYKGNQNGGDVDQSFKEALEMNELQVSFETLRAAHPSIQKVYVLCGSHTASASEIIINNLRPFMEVITIGAKTVGKDVAGFPIADERIAGQQGWVLYPSIYKLYNANNEGNYNEGIPPSIEMDELQEMEIFPLGNSNEVLLQHALNIISGNAGRTNRPAIHSFPRTRIYAEADPLLLGNP